MPLALPSAATRTAVIALIILDLLWGLGWPLIAWGLPYCPAIWYSTLRFLGATILAFLFMLLSRQWYWPSRRDLPLIFAIGWLQMGLFVLFFTLGLQHIPAGRATLITYLSPLFVTPAAVIWFGEKLTFNKIIGLSLGLAGVFVLLAPALARECAHPLCASSELFGILLLLLSALSRAVGLLCIRYGKWHEAPRQLLPWQLLAATVLNLVVAVVQVPHPVIVWHSTLLISLGYATLFSTLAAYSLSIFVTRRLPVVVVSLASLAVPVISLLFSAWLLHEPLTRGVIMAMVLIVGGLAAMAGSRSQKTAESHNFRR